MGLEDDDRKVLSSPPEGPHSMPVLDPVALQRLAELDPSGAGHLVERVLKAFKSSTERLRVQFDAGRSSGDNAALRLVSHTLKSSSASIGAMHLSRLSAQIENAIRLGAVDDLGSSLAAFDAALDEALAAVDAHLRETA